MREILVGQLLKLMSVGSKAAILFLVVPYMRPGEYSAYFLWTTIALLCARLLGTAAEEQILLLTKGSNRREYFFFGSATVYLFLETAIVSLLQALGVERPGICAFGLATCFLCNSQLSGIIRANFPFGFEMANGMPWIGVAIFSLVAKPVTSSELLVLVGATYTFSNIVLYVITFIRLGFRSIPINLRGTCYLFKLHGRWRTKVLSNLLVAVNLRNIPIVKGFSGQADDHLAIAFSIGEVCYQLAMVRVNRTFASKAVDRIGLYDQLTVFSEAKFVFLTVIQCGVGFACAMLLGISGNFLPGGLWLYLLAIAYCGFVTLFCFYRLHIWVYPNYGSDREVIRFQLILIGVVTLATLLIGENHVLILTGCMSVVACYFGFSIQRVRELKASRNTFR